MGSVTPNDKGNLHSRGTVEMDSPSSSCNTQEGEKIQQRLEHEPKPLKEEGTTPTTAPMTPSSSRFSSPPVKNLVLLLADSPVTSSAGEWSDSPDEGYQADGSIRLRTPSKRPQQSTQSDESPESWRVRTLLQEDDLGPSSQYQFPVPFRKNRPYTRTRRLYKQRQYDFPENERSPTSYTPSKRRKTPKRVSSREPSEGGAGGGGGAGSSDINNTNLKEPLRAYRKHYTTLNFFCYLFLTAGTLSYMAMLEQSMNRNELYSELSIPPPPSLLSSQNHPYQPAGGLRGTMVVAAGRSSPINTTRRRAKENPDKHKKHKSQHKKHDSSKQTSSHATVKTRSQTSNTKTTQTFDYQDAKFYRDGHVLSDKQHKRVVVLHPSILDQENTKKIQDYPSPFTDNTQYYSVFDSGDEKLQRMERREPYEQGECVPMQQWQTTFHPSCNKVHEIGLDHIGGASNEDDVHLFGTKGYWRNAWRLDVGNGSARRDTLVLKTLKIVHDFEDAHFEHNRVDAVAMDQLTSSPHVINAFGFCGHSVLTEYADGKRLGELADKSKRKPLSRLRIARDIADGLADVHGIDGDGNATFVHLDVNPANVVSVGGTLKLNDFNIGIIRRWNTTSNSPCGFPAQYPNPQWRSPEEARGENNLTEKVDVFSMGHIFFRLICGHEPWNKLELDGKPSKETIEEKVKKGIKPFIPKFVQESTDPEVIAIREAMLKCYTFSPEERPSARTIARALSDTLEKLSIKKT